MWYHLYGSWAGEEEMRKVGWHSIRKMPFDTRRKCHKLRSPHNKTSINEKEMGITSATEHGRHIMVDKVTTGAIRRKGRDKWQCTALLRVRTNTQIR